MNADHVDFADWDAAYVLGALSPSDRHRYEAHLAGCRACRGAVAELAPTLGLLSRVDPDRAIAALSPVEHASGPDPEGRGRIVAVAQQRVRRRRAMGWGGAIMAAAAAAAAIVVAVATAIVPAFRGIEVVALAPVADVPWTATVELSDAAWGTRIEMVCEYTGDAGTDAEWPYVLVVTAEDGTTTELSTWRARPGTTARLSAGTALEADEIAAIEIRAVEGGRVLMRSELGEPPPG